MCLSCFYVVRRSQYVYHILLTAVAELSWVGLTHGLGLGWVGCGSRIFNFSGLGWVMDMKMADMRKTDVVHITTLCCPMMLSMVIMCISLPIFLRLVDCCSLYGLWLGMGWVGSGSMIWTHGQLCIVVPHVRNALYS